MTSGSDARRSAGRLFLPTVPLGVKVLRFAGVRLRESARVRAYALDQSEAF